MKLITPFLALTLLPGVGWSADAPAATAKTEAGAASAAGAAKTEAKPAAADKTKGAATANPATPAAATYEPGKTATLDGALGLKFGMTSAEVHAAVPGSAIQPSGDVTILPTNLLGHSVGIHFQFLEDKLVTMLVIFNDPNGMTLEQRHKVYEDVGDKLKKKLGAPKEECLDGNAECNRWWGDGNNNLVQRRNAQMHGIDLYDVQVRETLLAQAKALGFGEAAPPPPPGK